MLRSGLLCVVLVVMAISLTSSAAAQSSSNGWQVAVAPYLWAAGMDGSMAIAERQQDFDVPFSTIVENLDLALMGHLDLRNDRWVVVSDLIYVDLEDDQGLERGSVTAGLELTLVEAAGGYRVTPAVTLLAGVRWVDMGTSLRYSGEVVASDADAGESWLDPLVGVHVLAPLSERWWLGLRGDVGGFGVGSDLTWQVYGDVGFRASDLISVMVGYHALDIDYETGSGLQAVGLDVMLSGPQLGVVFTF